MEQHSAVGSQGNICLKEKVQLQERSSSFVGFTELVNLKQHGAVGPKSIVLDGTFLSNSRFYCSSDLVRTEPTSLQGHGCSDTSASKLADKNLEICHARLKEKEQLDANTVLMQKHSYLACDFQADTPKDYSSQRQEVCLNEEHVPLNVTPAQISQEPPLFQTSEEQFPDGVALNFRRGSQQAFELVLTQKVCEVEDWQDSKVCFDIAKLFEEFIQGCGPILPVPQTMWMALNLHYSAEIDHSAAYTAHVDTPADKTVSMLPSAKISSNPAQAPFCLFSAPRSDLFSSYGSIQHFAMSPDQTFVLSSQSSFMPMQKPHSTSATINPYSEHAFLLCQSLAIAHQSPCSAKIVFVEETFGLLLDPSSSTKNFVKFSEDYLEVFLSFQNCLQFMPMYFIQTSAPDLLLHALNKAYRAGIG